MNECAAVCRHLSRATHLLAEDWLVWIYQTSLVIDDPILSPVVLQFPSDRMTSRQKECPESTRDSRLSGDERCRLQNRRLLDDTVMKTFDLHWFQVGVTVSAGRRTCFHGLPLRVVAKFTCSRCTERLGKLFSYDIISVREHLKQ